MAPVTPGFQPNSRTQTAAATEKFERSAYSSTQATNMNATAGVHATGRLATGASAAETVCVCIPVPSHASPTARLVR